MPSAEETHLHYMRLALKEAEKCVPSPGAFSVGCVLVDPTGTGTVLSTGYSRELPGNTHAEANALAKLEKENTEILSQADVYTTMEPCSVRTSGLAPCADALIKAKIKRCIIGVSEPADFVKCEGAQKLKDAGVELIWVQGLEDECLEVARRGNGNA